MSDLISRQAAINIVRGLDAGFVHFVEELPSAEPERKRGKWEAGEGYDGDEIYECSWCGTEFVLLDGTPKENGYNFCPSCGARMEEEEDET